MCELSQLLQLADTLIVDDDSMTVEYMKQCMAKQGYQCDFCYNGEEAVQLI